MKRFYLSITAFVIVFCTSVCASGANAVGAIPGQFNVSATGAATYEMPIECPSGVGGLKPELKFVYSSQLGDGLLGCGWTIGGLSAITKYPKSEGYEAFAIDGARLVKISEFSNVAEFRSENDIYTRIVGYEPQDQGFKYFKVFTKDGRTLTYGSANGDGSGAAWPLTEICDANGNYMTFQDITSYGGDINSTTGRIIYGKNKSGAGMETVIEFEYEQSPNAITQYLCGKAIDKWARVKRVRVLGNGFLPTVDYSLKYMDGGAKTDRSRLVSVSCCKGASNIGSTSFTWMDNNYCIKSVKDPQVSAFSTWLNIIALASGDITGDGITDRAYILKDKYKKYPLVIYKGTDNEIERKTDVPYENVFFYDIDHDGVEEVIATRFTQGKGSMKGSFLTHIVGKWNSSKSRLEWKSLDSYASAWNSPKPNGTTTRIPTNGSTWMQRRAELLGDFYGNGTLQFMPMYHAWKNKPDDIDIAAYIYHSIICPSHAHLRGTGGGSSDSCTIAPKKTTGYFPSIKNIASLSNCSFSAVNVNGNSKTDVMLVTNGGNIRFYEEKDGAFVKIMSNHGINGGSKGDVYTGDFNGDGNTDLLINRDGKAEIYLSTGKGFVRSDMGESIKLTKKSQISVIDINSDGKSELFVTDKGSASLYISTGRSYTCVATTNNIVFNPDESENEQVFKYMPVVSEMNSDSGIRYAEVMDGVLELSTNTIFDKIVKIEDGMHNTIAVEYGKQNPAGVVVTTVKTSNSAGECVTNRYGFSKLLYDNNLHRFMGFGAVSRTDEASGRSVVNSYSVNNSTMQLDRTDENVGAAKVKSVTYSYDVKTLGLNLRTSLVTKETEHDYLTGLEKSVEYQSYDEYGNPEKVVTKQGGQTITQEMTYIKLDSLNSIKPSQIKTTYSYGGNSEVRTRNLTYDSNGNLTTDSENGITKSYSNYDVFGNCQSVGYSSDVKYRAEEMTYTASGRHIESKTDAFGEKTEYKWDESKDLILEEKDAYGHKTTYKYDDLGGLKNKTTADGITVSTETKWAERNNVYKASYIVETATSGKGTVTTWYTSDGKEVCKKQKGLGGKDVYVLRQYNKDGTLSKISKPLFENMPREWAEQYIYDRYGRPMSITRADGRTNINYSGLTTIVTTPSEKVSKTLTAEGWTESVTTNGKTVRYTYYPTGELKTATPDGGEPVYMEYDKWGNRTKITDAESGTVTKKYNVFGELMESSHKQGSGVTVTTSYTYSPEGLLQQMSRGGSVTNYEYDSRNRLIQKTMAGGVSQSYEYDRYDRIIKTIDRIDGREFVRETSYDSEGRVQRETYPSGYYTENIYDENGVLVTVTDANGREIYKPLEATASGLITRESRGGKVTTYTFDGADRITAKVCDGIINHTYAYDAKGNLAQFSDLLSNQSCNYTYDELNRLTAWEHDTIAYDDANNMVRKSSLGDMILAYEDANHPHAVSSISGVPSSFPKDEQSITYTNFNNVESVSQGDMRYDITYGVGEQRIKSEYANAQGKTTRYYIGNYEEVIDAQGTTTKYCYLPGGAIMVEKNGEQKLYYNYTDRLGSIVATADAEGNVIERYAYDPWGGRLNPENWAEKDTRTSLFNNRGYTGHEHIDGLDLINMNGRMYDPLLGMFMSTDPFIQAPDNWLNYNRYLYGFGNPMKYIDPSGNIGIAAFIGIGAAVGAALGAGAGLWYGYNKGYSGWDLAKSALIGAGIGAGLGAASAYFIGSSISSVMASKTLWNFTQAGMSIGTAVGTVGGTAYGLANNADGLALANCIGLGSLIGMAAGAIIGAGCYYIWSLAAPVQAYADNFIAMHNCVEERKALDVTLSLTELEFDESLHPSAVVELADAIASARTATIWSMVGYTTLTGGVLAGAGYGYYQLTNLWLKD